MDGCLESLLYTRIFQSPYCFHVSPSPASFFSGYSDYLLLSLPYHYIRQLWPVYMTLDGCDKICSEVHSSPGKFSRQIKQSQANESNLQGATTKFKTRNHNCLRPRSVLFPLARANHMRNVGHHPHGYHCAGKWKMVGELIKTPQSSLCQLFSLLSIPLVVVSSCLGFIVLKLWETI